MEDDTQSGQPIASNRRKWLMRSLAVVLSLTPLVLLEIALRSSARRVAGAADIDPLVNLQQLRPLFVLDQQAGRWEIPPERFNFFQPQAFLAEKPTGLRRIFVLGGSTVQGRPYSTETSFATWLRLRLQAASPGTQFEVVNCGGVSYASYRVAKILDEILDHQPDAIVIYIGHNEFLEDREYQEVRDMNEPRKWIARVASNIKTISWIQSKLSGSFTRNSSMSDEVDARLDHAGGLEQYIRDPDWRVGVETHFAETLERMVTMTKQAGVPVVLCVPAGDLVNTPPFKLQQRGDLAPRQANAFRDAWSIAQDGSVSSDRRLAACVTCLAIDPEHAGANYVAGRLHYEQREAELAFRYLAAASDFDICPLRATTPIIQTVIDVARFNDVPLIHTMKRLDQRDSDGNRIPDGIVDPEFFVDHVHPTIPGHQLIGGDIALQIEQLGWFDAVPDADQRYASLTREHLARLGEEYYARGRQRLEGLRRWAAGRAGKPAATQPNE